VSGSGNITRRCPPDGWRRGAVSRGSACLEELLGGVRGILQCDCYRAYGNACGKASGNHAGRLLGAPAAQVSRSAADETNACGRPAERTCGN
jgi:hypothetical protein